MPPTETASLRDTNNKHACVYHLHGLCTRGARCKFSHEAGAPRPLCTFFFEEGAGCRHGRYCLYAHDAAGGDAAGGQARGRGQQHRADLPELGGSGLQQRQQQAHAVAAAAAGGGKGSAALGPMRYAHLVWC